MVLGSSEEFVSYLKGIEEKYPGLEDVVFQWPEGMPWSEFKEQLSIFAGGSNAIVFWGRDRFSDYSCR
ncbi:MAG: hypothetical protein CM1200mP15_10870 [Dehalococcoidia bacterium]|nr:MAG: hypothetical protein CM1200mP15_10870 [Dehalococcoidia bacterium]